jgi:hypothetical protein
MLTHRKKISQDGAAYGEQRRYKTPPYGGTNPPLTREDHAFIYADRPGLYVSRSFYHEVSGRSALFLRRIGLYCSWRPSHSRIGEALCALQEGNPENPREGNKDRE